jgi:hypothetical protein
MIPNEVIISDADCFGDRVPFDALGDAFGDLLGDAFGDALGDLLGDAFGDALGDALGDLLGDAFGDTSVSVRATERVWCRCFRSIIIVVI